MVQFTAQVIDNSPVADGYMHLTFTWGDELPQPMPGQFMTVGNDESTDPLLRRPFAFASKSSSSCSVVYQVRGKGTQVISARQPGESIDILGPLGNVFPELSNGHLPVLVAGGIGFGPIYYLAHTMIENRLEPTLVVGARTAHLVPDMAYPRNATICTDDGSKGFHGTVVDCLRSLDFKAPITLYACGPEPMLAACAEFAASANCDCWVSMEQIMGCAVGACMGCVIRIKGEKPYARVCTEGPVFNARDIVWS